MVDSALAMLVDCKQRGSLSSFAQTPIPPITLLLLHRPYARWRIPRLLCSMVDSALVMPADCKQRERVAGIR